LGGRGRPPAAAREATQTGGHQAQAPILRPSERTGPDLGNPTGPLPAGTATAAPDGDGRCWGRMRATLAGGGAVGRHQRSGANWRGTRRRPPSFRRPEWTGPNLGNPTGPLPAGIATAAATWDD